MSPLFSTSTPRRAPQRQPAQASRVPYVLPWLVSALTWVVLTWLTGAVVDAMARSAAIGWIGLAFSVALPLLAAAAGVSVLHRSVVRRGLVSWLIAGVPGPLLCALVGIVLAWGSAPAGARGLAAAALAIALVAAVLGALLAGALRARMVGHAAP